MNLPWLLPTLAVLAALVGLTLAAIALPTLPPMATLTAGETGETVCDGLYCGGPFRESLAFLILMVASVVGGVGVCLYAFRLRNRAAKP